MVNTKVGQLARRTISPISSAWPAASAPPRVAARTTAVGVIPALSCNRSSSSCKAGQGAEVVGAKPSVPAEIVTPARQAWFASRSASASLQ